jgi:hypothetical protein
MRLIPSRKQWRKWSLPSKLTALAIPLAVGLFLVPYFFPAKNQIRLLPPTEESVLCPHPIPFTVETVSPKFDSTFGKRVTIETPEKLFRAHIFTRTFIDRASLEEGFPIEGPHAAASGEGSKVAEIISPNGGTKFKVCLYASEDVKVICVERVN